MLAGSLGRRDCLLSTVAAEGFAFVCASQCVFVTLYGWEALSKGWIIYKRKVAGEDRGLLYWYIIIISALQ